MAESWSREEIVEAFAEAAHNAWLVEKYRRGVRSWPNEHGFEQMRPWDDINEDVREFDRVVVGAIYDVMIERGLID